MGLGVELRWARPSCCCLAGCTWRQGWAEGLAFLLGPGVTCSSSPQSRPRFCFPVCIQGVCPSGRE